MTPQERDRRIRELFEADAELLLRKGHDYAGDGDCLDNLREFGFLGVVVRLGDKFKRLKNFALSRQLQVKDESVRDTLRDLRNYGFLAEILLDEEKGER